MDPGYRQFCHLGPAKWIKYAIFLVIHLAFAFSSVAISIAANPGEQSDKVIFIDQLKQMGVAYEDGEKLFEFPVITGDDENTTDPGTYLVTLKDENYFSRKYQTPMPYSIFFDVKAKKAIHEGEVPSPAERIGLATHGCVHVEPPYIERLYDWTEEGKTLVVIFGRRTGK